MSPDGKNKKQLTSGQTEYWMPAWSPDGKKIAFVSRLFPMGMNIYVMDADGTNPQQLTSTGTNMSPSWSPDGAKIAFAYRESGAIQIPWDIWLMNADGANKRLLASGDDPSWSPDSKTVIHVWKTDCPASVSIGSISPDGSNQRLIFKTNCGFG